MTKQEILAKVNELIAAPSVCADVKAAAEAYAKNQDKASADALVKILAAEVCTVDELIGLCESETGVKFFGAEKAKAMAEAAKKSKAEGNKYCICPACQAGGEIYENREAL
ncbi:MAG: heat-shock protein Hsp90 [Synergistaceae bacterium]|nr:heat-shock protein Hsp90 [Synergistaceae bacterium]